MEPKAKAKKLINQFKDYVLIDYRGDDQPFFEFQKQCALICVKEILKEVSEWDLPHIDWWKKVKKEISLYEQN
jgi:hypothetical protein